jgi:cytochrome c oxidase subunit 3
MAFLGLILGLVSCTVLFAGLLAATATRRASGSDWVSLKIPPLTWLNTAFLLAGSAALEVSRRRLRAGRRVAFARLWMTGTALGALFLAGQILVWRQLAAAGVYVGSNPGSGFFYVLTAAHGAHVAGGFAALLYVGVQAVRWRLGAAKRTTADVSACFWHYLDVLWLVLLAFFLIW